MKRNSRRDRAKRQHNPEVRAELQEAQQQEDRPGPDPTDPQAIRVVPTGEILDLLEEIRARLGPDKENKATIIPVVPQDGGQNIAAGGSFDFSATGLPNVGGLVFDIPENIDASITQDGNPFLGVADGQGRSGTFEPPGNLVAPWGSVGITGINNASTDQDIGLWVATVYKR
jgi:hypothetical protein